MNRRTACGFLSRTRQLDKRAFAETRGFEHFTANLLLGCSVEEIRFLCGTDSKRLVQKSFGLHKESFLNTSVSDPFWLRVKF